MPIEFGGIPGLRIETWGTQSIEFDRPENFGPGDEIGVLLESGKRRFPGRKSP